MGKFSSKAREPVKFRSIGSRLGMYLKARRKPITLFRIETSCCCLRADLRKLGSWKNDPPRRALEPKSSNNPVGSVTA